MQEKNVEKAAEFRSSDLNIGGLLAISVPFFLRREPGRKAKFKLDINWRRKKGVPVHRGKLIFSACNSRRARERKAKKMFDNQKCCWRMRNGKGVESRELDIWVWAARYR